MADEIKVNDRVATLTRAYREAPAAQKSTIREQLKPLLGVDLTFRLLESVTF